MSRVQKTRNRYGLACVMTATRIIKQANQKPLKAGINKPNQIKEDENIYLGTNRTVNR